MYLSLATTVEPVKIAKMVTLVSVHPNSSAMIAKYLTTVVPLDLAKITRLAFSAPNPSVILSVNVSLALREKSVTLTSTNALELNAPVVEFALMASMVMNADAKMVTESLIVL